MANLSPDEIVFHQASKNGDTSQLKNVFSKIANSKDEEGKTPLINAVEKGDLKMVIFLIKNEADVNIQDLNGLTPIHYAARAYKGLTNHFAIAYILIENGADVDSKNKDGLTPLYFASHNGNLELVKFLINHMANVNQSCGVLEMTPLHVASLEGKARVVKYLLENGAVVDAKEKHGYTPLCVASSKGHLESVKYLIEFKAKVNQKCLNEYTPLHIAVENGQIEIVKYLIENGANIDEENKNGKTPLYLAIEFGKQNIVKYLTETKNKSEEKEIPRETYSNKDPCIICMKPRNQLYALMPCGHTSMCETCCIKVKIEPYSKCPSCRKPIKSYNKIFFQAPK